MWFKVVIPTSFWKLQVQLMTPFDKNYIKWWYLSNKISKTNMGSIFWFLVCFQGCIPVDAPAQQLMPRYSSFRNVPCMRKMETGYQQQSGLNNHTDEFTFYFPRLSWKNSLTQSNGTGKKNTFQYVPNSVIILSGQLCESNLKWSRTALSEFATAKDTLWQFRLTVLDHMG